MTTPIPRDTQLSLLFNAAAEKTGGQGRKLVLLVDGLDEDRDGQPGSGPPSIASLLPEAPGDVLRVVVTGRPDHRLPIDVPAGHPLRRCRVRELSPSPYAGEIAATAPLELDELLHGDQEHRDVLGLITACGDGLTCEEFEDLTGIGPDQVTGRLGTLVKGTVTARAHRRHLFTHETLRETAVQRLGAALDGCRDRLHAWAERYRSRGWPDTTPRYLLFGYPRMLQETRDVARLTALATDSTRHDRMLDHPGGDVAALAEILAAQELALSSDQPDLLGMARLSMRRTDLTTRARTANLPIALPAVWATLNQPVRAGALARSIRDPYRRFQALALLAEAVAAAGDHEQARMLVGDAEQIARSITVADQQASVPALLARALAAADGERQTARSVAESDGPAEAPGAAGEYEQAGAVADDVEQSARSIVDPDRRASALTAVASTVAAAGDNDRARTIAGDAEQIARSVVDPHRRTWALTALVRAVGAAGDLDRARVMAGDAAQVARSITDPDWRTSALTALVRALGGAGDLDRARAIAGDAVQAARTVVDPDDQAWALAEVVDVIAEVGDHEHAAQIARSIAHPDLRAGALATVAEAGAAAGDPRRAARIAPAVTNADPGERTMTDLVGAAVAAGDVERAVQIARTIKSLFQRARTLADLAVVTGLPRGSRLLAEAFTVGPWQVPMLALAKLNPELSIRIADAAYAEDWP